MPSTLLMEFDKKSRRFDALREIELVSIPSKDDKIVIDIDGIGYIFRIHDVHYADNNRFEINIIRISTISDYYASNYSDIN